MAGRGWSVEHTLHTSARRQSAATSARSRAASLFRVFAVVSSRISSIGSFGVLPARP